jgi:hypothetical protein
MPPQIINPSLGLAVAIVLCALALAVFTYAMVTI